MRASGRWRRTLLPFALLAAACARSEQGWARELACPDPFRRALAALALCEGTPVYSADVVGVLLETVDRTDLGLERAAAAALARVAPRASEALLGALVADEFMTLERRQAVVAALSTSGSRGAARIVAALRGSARGLAGELGVVLVRIGSPAVEPLCGLLSDATEPRLQGYAAFVLGQIGAPARPALPALRAQVAHPDPAVQAAVAEAIARIEGDASGPRGPTRAGAAGD